MAPLKGDKMISIFGIEKPIIWDEIIKSFNIHDVYYLSSYVKALQLHGDGEPNLVYYNNEKTRAINVVMKRDIADSIVFHGKIPEDTWFDFATPYGYGGFIVEGNDTSAVNEAYTEYCFENNIVSEFVRFHPLFGNADVVRRMYQVQALGKTVHIDLKDANKIWDNFTGKNRNVVRKSKRLGVNIYWGRNEELFEKFKKMYNDTMKAQNAAPYYYFGNAFYKSILHDLGNQSMIFYAEYDSQIIAMAIILFCNGQMHYHLSASDWKYRSYAATNLLLYEAALWGNANGYKTFHLGGGVGGTEDSLYKFKKSFNRGPAKTFYIGRKCFNKEMYNTLVKLRKQEDDNFNDDSPFFPLYRA